MLDKILKQASKLHAKQNLYMGKHENSDEFNDMMAAFGDFIDKAKKPNADIDVLCSNMSTAATIYREKKDKQWRLIPSAMRVVRLNLADTIKNIGDMYKAGLASVKEHPGFEEVKKYYQEQYQKVEDALHAKESNNGGYKKEKVEVPANSEVKKGPVNKDASNKPKEKLVEKTNPKPAESKSGYNFEVLEDAEALSKDSKMLKVAKALNEILTLFVESEKMYESTYGELDDDVKALIPVEFLIEKLKVNTQDEIDNMPVADIAQHFEKFYFGNVYEKAAKLAESSEPEVKESTQYFM